MNHHATALLFLLLLTASIGASTIATAQVGLRHPPVLEESPIVLDRVIVDQAYGETAESLALAALFDTLNWIQPQIPSFYNALAKGAGYRLLVNITFENFTFVERENTFNQTPNQVKYDTIFYIRETFTLVTNNGSYPLLTSRVNGRIGVNNAYIDSMYDIQLLLGWDKAASLLSQVEENRTLSNAIAKNVSLMAALLSLYSAESVVNSVASIVNQRMQANNTETTTIEYSSSGVNPGYIVYWGPLDEELQARIGLVTSTLLKYNLLQKIEVEFSGGKPGEYCIGPLSRLSNSTGVGGVEAAVVKQELGGLHNVLLQAIGFTGAYVIVAPDGSPVTLGDPVCVGNESTFSTGLDEVLTGIVGTRLLVSMVNSTLVFGAAGEAGTQGIRLEYLPLILFVHPLYQVQATLSNNLIAVFLSALASQNFTLTTNNTMLSGGVSQQNTTREIPKDLAGIVANITSGNETQALQALEKAYQLYREGKISESLYRQLLDLYASEYGRVPEGLDVGGNTSNSTVVDLNRLLQRINEVNNLTLQQGGAASLNASARLNKSVSVIQKTSNIIRRILDKIRENAAAATAALALPLVGIAMAYASREIDLSKPSALARVLVGKPPTSIEPLRRATWCYETILYLLSLHGIEKLEWETPREFLERAKKILDSEWAAILEEITEAYELEKYASEPVMSTKQVIECVRRIRRLLLPWRLRRSG